MSKSISYQYYPEFANGLFVYGFDFKTGQNTDITYYWIFSGESPSPIKRGQWTDDGVWGTTEVWMG
jgi:hypothetical protein